MRLTKPLLLALILYPAIVFNQNSQIKGCIFDGSSKEKIPYAHIYLKRNGAGTISKKNGEFKLIIPQQKIVDTVVFSALGYNTKELPLGKTLNTDTLYLHKKTYQLPPVTVIAQKQTIMMGSRNNRKINGFADGITMGSNKPGGTIFALYIENTDNINGIIKSVRFYIEKRGHPDTKFRVRIFERNYNDSCPGKDLLHKNVIIHGDQGNEWVYADLEKYYIEIPKHGFFVAMETLPDAKPYKTAIMGNTVYGNVLAGTKEFGKKNLTWITNIRTKYNKWFILSPKKYNAKISAEIIVFDD